MPAHDPLPIPPELMVVGEEPFDDEEIDRLAGEVPSAIGRPDDPDLERVDAEIARWRITGPATAQWAMAKYAALTAQIEAAEEQAGEWRQRIDAWFDQAARRLEQRRRFFAGHLGRYAIEQRQLDPKANKTTYLPSGTVATTERAEQVDIGNKAMLIAWAKEKHPDLLKQDIGVTDLRSVAKVIERVERVALTLHCGCILDLAWDADKELPLVGTAWECPDDGEVLLGRVEVVESHPEVRDLEGQPVPGAVVKPGDLTYTVKPQS